VLADEMGAIPQPELEDDFFAGGIGFQAAVQNRPIGRGFQLFEAGSGGHFIEDDQGVVEGIGQLARVQQETGDFPKIIAVGQAGRRQGQTAGMEIGFKAGEEFFEQGTTDVFEYCQFGQTFKLQRIHGLKFLIWF
jgi:hypothetical protein